jgi:iron complex outermembrane receptor protein
MTDAEIPASRARARWRAVTVLIAALLAPAGAAAQAESPLDQMTLEELMNVPVTTVSRTPELSSRVPAALFVITSDDIRHSGATTLPELLRMAPGMQVARVDAGKWAMGMRGFADRLSRSMLVLIDGRAVYSPLFAGTYWETQHVMLQDIERIEVIRGPGGTLWGSNAVNGIINVITRSARDTQRGLIAGGVGTEVRARGALRYGGAVGEQAWLRGYVSGFDNDARFATGPVEYDEWRLAQAGFRLDANLAGARSLRLQGDFYEARLGEWVVETSLLPPYQDAYPTELPLRGGNLHAELTSPLGSDTDLALRTYYEVTDRDEYPVSEARRTFDVDVQLSHYGFPRQQIVWGAGYRLSSAEIVTAPTASLPDGSEALLSVFAQDEVSLAERLSVTLGAKLEHNRYSGVEVQPSARAALLLSPTTTLWAAATRAVRRPSRVERHYATTSILSPAVPAFIRLSPNPDFAPETLWAYEAGVRTRPHERLYVTISGFYNDWRDLLSTELLAAPFQETVPPAPTRTIYPVGFGNGIDGHSSGFEASLDARPTAWWRVAGHYAYLSVWMMPKPGSADLTQESRYEGGSPAHQVGLRNTVDLPRGVALDWHLRHVSELPDLEISSYTTADARLAWSFLEDAEIEVVGRNLHDAHHAEWPGDNGAAVEIQRSWLVGLTWRW